MGQVKNASSLQPFHMTLKYKESEEYKSWFAAVREENPGMPEYLIDMAIMMAKMNPHLHKDRYKHDKEYNRRKQEETPKKPDDFVIPGAVRIIDPDHAQE